MARKNRDRATSHFDKWIFYSRFVDLHEVYAAAEKRAEPLVSIYTGNTREELIEGEIEKILRERLDDAVRAVFPSFVPVSAKEYQTNDFRDFDCDYPEKDYVGSDPSWFLLGLLGSAARNIDFEYVASGVMKHVAGKQEAATA